MADTENSGAPTEPIRYAVCNVDEQGRSRPLPDDTHFHEAMGELARAAAELIADVREAAASTRPSADDPRRRFTVAIVSNDQIIDIERARVYFEPPKAGLDYDPTYKLPEGERREVVEVVRLATTVESPEADRADRS